MVTVRIPRHVVMFSSGAGSAVAAKRVADLHGTDHLTLLFADVNGEHPDNYRFLREASEWIGGQLVILDNQGRTIWDVFHEARFLANTRIDPCSRILKREPMRKWLEANCRPRSTTVYLGFDWTEAHRLDRAAPHWEPWEIRAPMCEAPYLDKADMMKTLTDVGIEPPLLTRLGFPHANCGGGCVKAGAKQFKKLLNVLPDEYAKWEAGEEDMRVFLGKDIAILRDRTGGTTKPLTLKRLRMGLQEDAWTFEDQEEWDWGGCGCMNEPVDT